MSYTLQIHFANRLRGDIGLNVLLSLDCTDYEIQEPFPFSTKWYGHKKNGPAVRYEVGVNIQTGDICWTYGPFPPGEWPDINIARRRIIHLLDPTELIAADGGYADGMQYFLTPTGHNDLIGWLLSVLRHETVNGRFKNWGILKQVFRHNVNKHGFVFNAIANITQLDIENGHPLFPVFFRFN